jgi:hypothetical protein
MTTEEGVEYPRFCPKYEEGDGSWYLGGPRACAPELLEKYE